MGNPATRGTRSIFYGFVAAVAVLLPACADDAPQDYLEPVGRAAEKADGLWDLTFLIAAIIFVLVEAALVYAVIRFRYRPGREAAQFHGNTKLEVFLTVVPALILAGIAVPTVSTIIDLSERPRDALNVTVIAHQFWWQYTYPDLDVATANELHIPTGQDVYVTLEGAVDNGFGEPEVIHSFWVPKLSGKQDVVPGRRSHLILYTDEPGTYFGQCTEYCGLSHSRMKLRVIAQPPEEFEQWVADQQQPPEEPPGSVAEGAELFSQGQFADGPPCSACHSVGTGLDDEGKPPAPAVGPNLAHFASRSTFAGALLENNESNLRRWLQDPPEVKEGSLMPDLGLTGEQIDALIAYLQSLE